MNNTFLPSLHGIHNEMFLLVKATMNFVPAGHQFNAEFRGTVKSIHCESKVSHWLFSSGSLSLCLIHSLLSWWQVGGSDSPLPYGPLKKEGSTPPLALMRSPLALLLYKAFNYQGKGYLAIPHDRQEVFGSRAMYDFSQWAETVFLITKDACPYMWGQNHTTTNQSMRQLGLSIIM